MLKELEISSFYNSKKTNIVNEFYIPVLSNCTCYKRVSAFFDSNILKLYSVGIENIVKNHGHIYFIFSKEITESDFNLMKDGYRNREINKIKENLLEDISDLKECYSISNLAYLIANNFVDVKIAFTKSGILHDKFGIISDKTNCIYFRGSNNETVASIINNFESFETSCDWNCDRSEESKIQNAKNEFDLLWNNNYADTIIIDIPTIVKKKILSFNKGKLLMTSCNAENSFIFDCDEENNLIGFNKLNDYSYLLPGRYYFDNIFSPFLFELPKNENDIYNFDKKANYILKQEIIENLRQQGIKKDFDVVISPQLYKYFYDCDIKAEKRRSLGIAIKENNSILKEEFAEFCSVVKSNMVRELRIPQLWGSYHVARMMRSANFSVPGAGKTSIVYGAFAYLCHKQIVNKIVMIGPLNSFSAWKNEFKLNFGNKMQLNCFDYQENTYKNSQERYDSIAFKTENSNLILINYESIPKNIDSLKKIIDEKTLLVFDEVHRIKNVEGIRAKGALDIVEKSRYRVVLSGTPIPNGYVDVYNFLHLLFNDEYKTLFNFDLKYLKTANKDVDKSNTINHSIYPFFCRTTKDELQVPPPEEDDLKSCFCNFDSDFEKILKIIYRECSSNILLLYIRLIQASTNPKLVLKKLTQFDFNSFDDSCDDVGTFQDKFKLIKQTEEYTKAEMRLINEYGFTEKFYKGIELAKKIVKEKEQCIIWCIFVDTINDVKIELERANIKSEVIYGITPLEERERIIADFISKKIDVLITNPQTLAESVSLHKNCHHAIYLEYSFNLVHMLQSRDRIHRLGLNPSQKTFYHYCVMNKENSEYNAIDYKMYNRLKQKAILQKNAIEGKKLIYIDDNMIEDIKSILERNE